MSISILISIITIILSADFSNNKSASSPNGSPDDTSAPSKDTKWHLCQSSIYIFYSDKSALFFIQLLPCTFFQNWIKYIFLMRKALYDLQLYTSVSTKPESHSPSERIFPWIFFKIIWSSRSNTREIPFWLKYNNYWNFLSLRWRYWRF